RLLQKSVDLVVRKHEAWQFPNQYAVDFRPPYDVPFVIVLRVANQIPNHRAIAEIIAFGHLLYGGHHRDLARLASGTDYGQLHPGARRQGVEGIVQLEPVRASGTKSFDRQYLIPWLQSLFLSVRPFF